MLDIGLRRTSHINQFSQTDPDPLFLEWKDAQNSPPHDSSQSNYAAECAVLRDELHCLEERYRIKVKGCQQTVDDKIRQMKLHVDGLREEKMALVRRVQEQAMTIHQLTINESTDLCDTSQCTDAPSLSFEQFQQDLPPQSFQNKKRY